MTYPSQNELNAFFSYDPDTGEFKRLDGGTNPPAYVRIGGGETARYNAYFNNRMAGDAQTLCFIMHTGVVPKEPVELIDPNEGLKFSNFAYDTDILEPEVSTVKGVFFDKNCGKWRAAFSRKGKRINVGVFLTVDEAQQAMIDARRTIEELENSEKPSESGVYPYKDGRFKVMIKHDGQMKYGGLYPTYLEAVGAKYLLLKDIGRIPKSM